MSLLRMYVVESVMEGRDQNALFATFLVDIRSSDDVARITDITLDPKERRSLVVMLKKIAASQMQLVSQARVYPTALWKAPDHQRPQLLTNELSGSCTLLVSDLELVCTFDKDRVYALDKEGNPIKPSTT